MENVPFRLHTLLTLARTGTAEMRGSPPLAPTTFIRLFVCAEKNLPYLTPISLPGTNTLSEEFYQGAYNTSGTFHLVYICNQLQARDGRYELAGAPNSRSESGLAYGVCVCVARARISMRPCACVTRELARRLARLRCVSSAAAALPRRWRRLVGWVSIMTGDVLALNSAVFRQGYAMPPRGSKKLFLLSQNRHR